MTLTEKIVSLIVAKTDKERYDAVASMTDKQKDIIIVSLVKVLQEQGINLTNMSI